MDSVTIITILVVLAIVLIGLYFYGRSRTRLSDHAESNETVAESRRRSVNSGLRTRDDPRVPNSSSAPPGEADVEAPDQADQASVAGNPTGRELKEERIDQRERERNA